jgi:hypothetical protein
MMLGLMTCLRCRPIFKSEMTMNMRKLKIFATIILIRLVALEFLSAADLTVDNLTVNSNTTIKGEPWLMSGTNDFGQFSTIISSNLVIQPSLTWYVTDQSGKTISSWQAWRAGAEWIWARGVSNSISQMYLDSANRLTLYNTNSVPVANIILDPVGVSSFKTSVTFAGNNNTMTAQTITGASSILTAGLGDARYPSKSTITTGTAGSGLTATGVGSVAMGFNSKATNSYAVAIGNGAVASGVAAIAMGQGSKAYGSQSVAMGYLTVTSNNYATAMGNSTLASGLSSTAMGYHTTAEGEGSTTIGGYNRASGVYSFAGGSNSVASGAISISLGVSNLANGMWSTALGGYENVATGAASVVIGSRNKAYGTSALVIGNGSIASNQYSQAFGYYTVACKDFATTFGNSSIASGYCSTAMGAQTLASGGFSTALGCGSIASGYKSTAIGYATSARGMNQVVIGKYNIPMGTNYSSEDDLPLTDMAFIIGNGMSIGATITNSNALTVNWKGDTWMAGGLTVNGAIRVPPQGDISMGSFTNGPAGP